MYQLPLLSKSAVKAWISTVSSHPPSHSMASPLGFPSSDDEAMEPPRGRGVYFHIARILCLLTPLFSGCSNQPRERAPSKAKAGKLESPRWYVLFLIDCSQLMPAVHSDNVRVFRDRTDTPFDPPSTRDPSPALTERTTTRSTSSGVSEMESVVTEVETTKRRDKTAKKRAKMDPDEELCEHD